MEVERHRLTRGIKRWFILTGAFFVSFLETGTIRSLGVIINDMTTDFQSSTAFVGTVIGMAHGVMFWLSVLNTPLLRRFSVRQVVMVGGFVGSVGLILSSFAASGTLFAASLFLFGVGFSTVILPAHSSPVDYFPDLFEIASSITLTGGGFGLMVLPLLFEVFVTDYGWRGALMLLGAINLNTLVSGALLEPIQWAEGGEDDEERRRMRRKEQEMLEQPSGSGSSCDAAEAGIPPEYHDRDDSSQDEQETYFKSEPEDFSQSANTNSNCEAGVTRLDKFGKQQISAPCNRSCILNRTVTKASVASEDSKVEDNERNCCSRWLHGAAKSFDLYLFVDYPVLFGICLATVLFGVSYDGWVLFVIPNAEAKGFDSQLSVYIAMAGGVGNIPGRFCIGFLTAKKWFSNEVLYLIMNLLSAFAFCINLSATSFWALLLLSFINGFSLGAKTSLGFIIVNGAVATHRYKAAVSMLLVSLGLGFPFAGALLGGIYDRTSSYNISFCVIGCIDVICGFIITAPLIFSSCRRRLQRYRQRNTVSVVPI